MINFLFQM